MLVVLSTEKPPFSPCVYTTTALNVDQSKDYVSFR